MTRRHQTASNQATFGFDSPASVGTPWRLQAPPCLDGHTDVTLDLETTGLNWRKDKIVGVAVTTPADGGRYYLPLRHRGENLDIAQVERWAQTELRGKRIRNRNIKFDTHLMRQLGADLPEMGCTFLDPGWCAALLDDHRKVFNLDALAQAELGRGKIDSGPKTAMQDQTAASLAPYAIEDCVLVDELLDVYRPRINAQGLGRTMKIEADVFPCVVEMERNGMPLDMGRLAELADASRALLDHLVYELYREVGFRINPNATADLVRLWRHCGEPIVHYTAGSATRDPQPSFTAPVVQEAAKKHPAIAMVWRIGKLIDLRTKYLVKYQQDAEDGVLYPTLNQLATDEGGTVSGRFSCVEPNLQQVMGADKFEKSYGWLREYSPLDFRIKTLFRADEENVWVSADMRQVEYRIFTHYSGSKRLLDLYAADPMTNFHSVVDGYIRPFKPDINKTEVKVGNFLSVYGGGVPALINILGMSPGDAQTFSDTYHRQFPEARATGQWATSLAEEQGFVTTLRGRRSRFLGKPGLRQNTHKALNCIVQGTAADAMKETMAAAWRERKFLELILRMTVHDSLEAEAQNRTKLKAYHELLETQRLPLKVPLLWDFNTGRTWADCK